MITAASSASVFGPRVALFPRTRAVGPQAMDAVYRSLTFLHIHCHQLRFCLWPQSRRLGTFLLRSERSLHVSAQLASSLSMNSEGSSHMRMLAIPVVAPPSSLPSARSEHSPARWPASSCCSSAWRARTSPPATLLFVLRLGPPAHIDRVAHKV